ncbi:MAG: GreA/GreB family elongation factor [Variovorax sp.]|nr:GreA/GreB family elongation factor [Variovorax sp.]
MQSVVHGERMLTDLDFARLSKFSSAPLADLLAGAEITSARTVKPEVITMYSRAEVVDVYTRRRQVVTVCYPGDAEPAAGFISVLSPLGTGLLGLQTGDVARWLIPTGEECAAEIAAVQYQPEASGDYAR